MVKIRIIQRNFVDEFALYLYTMNVIAELWRRCLSIASYLTHSDTFAPLKVAVDPAEALPPMVTNRPAGQAAARPAPSFLSV